MFQPNGVPILIRRTHEERILSALRDGGPLSRSEIETRVNLSRTTVSEITGELLARGAIAEMEAASGAHRGRGRPAARLALDPTSGQFLGVDFGHRRVYAVAVNASNDVIASGSMQFDEDATWPVRIAAALKLLDSFEGESTVCFGALEGIGVGVSGPLGYNALVRSSTWSGAATRQAIELVQETFSKRYDAPILVDNNTRFASLAEAVWGHPTDVDSLLYARIADGVGGGLVVGGRLIAGAYRMAGELGHVQVPGASSRCWCGKRGCLETIVAVPALIRAAKRYERDVTSLRDIANATSQGGHDGIRTVIERAARALGSTLATVTTVLDPREVVVAGEVLQLGDVFFDVLTQTYERGMIPSRDITPTLRASSLGDEAGALGAIAAAFHRSPLLAGYEIMGDSAPAERNRTQRAGRA